MKPMPMARAFFCIVHDRVREANPVSSGNRWLPLAKLHCLGLEKVEREVYIQVKEHHASGPLSSVNRICAPQPRR
ncbi:hypothetical protein VTO42DRAFT_3808 [Malbranchea cinnamomea]